jgi:transposase
MAMYQSDPELNRTTASEILQVSRRTVINWINKLDKK